MKKAFVVITVLCLLMTSFACTVFAQAAEAKAPPLSMQYWGRGKYSKPPIINNRIPSCKGGRRSIRLQSNLEC